MKIKFTKTKWQSPFSLLSLNWKTLFDLNWGDFIKKWSSCKPWSIRIKQYNKAQFLRNYSTNNRFWAFETELVISNFDVSNRLHYIQLIFHAVRPKVGSWVLIFASCIVRIDSFKMSKIETPSLSSISFSTNYSRTAPSSSHQSITLVSSRAPH